MLGAGHGRHLHKEAIEFLKREHLFPGHGGYFATSAAIGIEPLICEFGEFGAVPISVKTISTEGYGVTLARS